MTQSGGYHLKLYFYWDLHVALTAAVSLKAVLIQILFIFKVNRSLVVKYSTVHL